MPNKNNVLPVFIDARSFATTETNNTFHHLSDIQRKAWEGIGKRLRKELPSCMVLMDPFTGVFQDDQERQMVTQCLQSQSSLTPEVSERFRDIVVDTYSRLLGTQIACIETDASRAQPIALV